MTSEKYNKQTTTSPSVCVHKKWRKKTTYIFPHHFNSPLLLSPSSFDTEEMSAWSRPDYNHFQDGGQSRRPTGNRRDTSDQYLDRAFTRLGFHMNRPNLTLTLTHQITSHTNQMQHKDSSALFQHTHVIVRLIGFSSGFKNCWDEIWL